MTADCGFSILSEIPEVSDFERRLNEMHCPTRPPLGPLSLTIPHYELDIKDSAILSLSICARADRGPHTVQRNQLNFSPRPPTPRASMFRCYPSFATSSSILVKCFEIVCGDTLQDDPSPHIDLGMFPKSERHESSLCQSRKGLFQIARAISLCILV